MTTKLARANQIRLFQAILDHAPLETDARSEIRHIIRVLEDDIAVTMQFTSSYLYPFLTHTLSTTQTILLKHLAGFKGRLLNKAYDESHGTWHGYTDSEDYEDDLNNELTRISWNARVLGVERLNGPQLAFALMLTPDSGYEDFELPNGAFRRKRTSRLRPLIDYTFEEVSFFPRLFEGSGITSAALVRLSKELISYDGTNLLTPEIVASRFALAFSVNENRLSIRPVERWGLQQVAESSTSDSATAELWLPNDKIVRQDELLEFEDLLGSRSVAENDWQRFLETHPVFMYILGDYDAYRREVRLYHQPIIDDCEEPDLRPDFLLRRIGLDAWDILEIKLPQAPVAVGRRSRRRLSSAVSDAIAQLRQYREFFQDKSNLEWFHSCYKLRMSYPRLNLLVGRDASFGSKDEKLRLTNTEEVKIFTYDDLHRIAQHSCLTEVRS